MEDQIKDIISKISGLPKEQIASNSLLEEELGFNSMKLLRLINDLEEWFEIEFDMEEYEAENFKSIQVIQEIVSKKKQVLA